MRKDLNVIILFFTFISALFSITLAQVNHLNDTSSLIGNSETQENNVIEEEQPLKVTIQEQTIDESTIKIAKYSKIKKGGAITLGSGVFLIASGVTIALIANKENSDALNAFPPEPEKLERTENFIYFGSGCVFTGFFVTIGGIVVTTIGSIKFRKYKRKYNNVSGDKITFLFRGNSLVLQYNF